MHQGQGSEKGDSEGESVESFENFAEFLDIFIISLFNLSLRIFYDFCFLPV